MALGDGITWDETLPDKSSLAYNLDNYNVDLRKGVRLRLAQEHEYPSSQAAVGDVGKHKFMTLQMQTGAPPIGGTQTGAIYQKTVSTEGDYLFFLNSATREINLTKKLYFWYIDGALEVESNASATLVLVSDGKILNAKAYASTAPSGSELQIDINYNDVSIWTSTSNQLILSAGSTSTGVNSFVTTNVVAGGILRIDVDKIGSGGAGSNATVMLEVG